MKFFPYLAKQFTHKDVLSGAFANKVCPTFEADDQIPLKLQNLEVGPFPPIELEQTDFLTLGKR